MNVNNYIIERNGYVLYCIITVTLTSQLHIFNKNTKSCNCAYNCTKQMIFRV